MLSRIRNRRETTEQDENDGDTKAFLLNRKVTVKEGVDVGRDYRICEFIGSGKFGDVNRCAEKLTNYELAAKVIPYSCPDEKEAVINEVDIMCRLRHPRLIQLYDVFIQRDRITLIMELITGGELFERVIDDNFELDEATCEKFMRQILHGVEYIHSQRVIHLDLKPENILCLSKTSFKIKIIDFGLAREVVQGDLRVMFGTPEFVAPEIISYDPVTYATDMWSVGVVCYVLLSGLSPFMGDNEGETLSNIVRCNYTFEYPEFKDISKDAKEFIKSLLNKDPRKRLTATQCLVHPWLKEKTRLKRTATVSKKRLRHFVYRRKWQKAVNAIIALQRMGVVLTYTPNKEPEYRKLLQAKTTKTAAILRKSSIRITSNLKAADGNMEPNQSLSTTEESTVKAPAQNELTSSLGSQQASPKRQNPKINIQNPSKPDLKPSIVSPTQKQNSHNSIATKLPPLAPLKKELNHPTEQTQSQIASSQKNRSPNLKDSTSLTKNAFQSSPNVGPKPTSPGPLSPKLIAKPETEIKLASSAVANKTKANSSVKNTLISPVKEPAPSTPRKQNSSLPKPSSSTTAAQPFTAPPAPASTATVALTATAPLNRSNVQPSESILMKMISLPKSRGNVADRINFFNNSSPRKDTKSAKVNLTK